ncbi:Protein PBN1 [Candida viswanathii]|uniref:Protein PBN1 n=1 Tax=Candida viswanathii TaxID=5486 RepID=A0A367XXX1_9ASCO|nr:Protein PBN1 [Candida viswanathii]
MRQRTTIFNPYTSHDGIVTNANKTNFQLSSIKGYPFVVENKFTTRPATEYPAIKLLRIQTKFDKTPSNDPVFQFDFTPGVNIYAVPEANVDEQAFWEQVGKLTTQVLKTTIPRESWIQTLNSFYFYDLNPLALHNFKLHEHSNYDYTFTNDKVTVREFLTDVENLNCDSDPELFKEVGLFLIDDKISSPDDLNLVGLRVVLDEADDDQNIHKTMFHIKPRHRYLGEAASKIIPQGLHPILNTKIDVALPEEFDVQECKLYYYLNVNKSLIFDEFQNVPDGAQLVINNGNKNLELPEYKINEWGNEVLFEFDDIIPEVNLTLHSRYQLPENAKEEKDTTIINSSPEIFIGCNVKEANLLNKSPFDTKSTIGGNYEVYFTEDTVFYHLLDQSDDRLTVGIPHGTTTFDRVNSITIISLVLGVLFILYSIITRLFTPKVKKD